MVFPRTLICGIGNRLRRDDGVGPCVIDELEKRPLPADVSLTDFGTSGFRTALEIGEYDKVVLVDAIRLGNQPGQVYRTTPGKEDLLQSSSLASCAISLHESDLERILATAALIDNYPQEVVVLGCEPGDLSFGLGLSREVGQAVGRIVDLILDEIR